MRQQQGRGGGKPKVKKHSFARMHALINRHEYKQTCTNGHASIRNSHSQIVYRTSTESPPYSPPTTLVSESGYENVVRF
jgi:hypothetical protein